MKLKLSLPLWTIIAPVFAWLAYAGIAMGWGDLYTVILANALIGGVLAAVYHAEVVAHRVGEPFGTLVLAIAVTFIEVSLIVSLMLAGGPEASALARDTVFAAVMILLTGIVGLCLLSGGARYHEQAYGVKGVSAALVTLIAILTLTLVLPNYTTSMAGPVFNYLQQIFIGIVSLILYGSFVLVQTVRHRDFFLPPNAKNDEDLHAAPPTTKVALLSLAFLLSCLGAVVLLAKALAPTIEAGVVRLGAPNSFVGVIIAGLVLLPEGLAAWRAAKNNRLQTSLNLALGSALASIGLTIPAVAVMSSFTGLPITLGIDVKSIVLLFLSLFTIMIPLSTGRTNILHGIVLLVIFAVYLFTSIVP
ncbi:ionic transporter y4hA [Adhaeribacter swui]|uniref:Ionic transporter y4hA n=1 Tax=Adhaeribacter swui TaxID=2086471 RepID=A0A7G7G9F5_9BACT|nr:ionic transporter y4hA [Adhaeribacter swui]QNF33789.1 ionic transporter y4hA [Adhaeribacter swui]